jgi:arylsulfatase A-like enzyme
VAAPRPGRAALLLALLATAACAPDAPSPEPDFVRPLLRFAGGGGDPRAAAPPSATLLDDTRPVLGAPGRVDLGAPRAPLGRDGALRLEAPLPASYAGVSHALGSLVLFSGGERHELPRRLYALEKRGANRVLVLRIRVPAELSGSGRVGFRLLGVGIPEAPESRVETPPLVIPAGARIEFAIGVLEPDFADGPVAFELAACHAGDCEPLYAETLDPARAEQRGWQERRVGLAELAGEHRRLRFTSRRVEGATTSLAAWADPTLLVPAARPAGAANVILISIDTLRADHLPSYGYARDTAPFVDEYFARGGVLFESVSAASAVTAPSHMTIFTGLQPSAHGVTDGLRTLPPTIPTLPEELRAHGVTTAAFTEDGWVGVHQGFARGFDRFVENKSAEIMVPEGQVDRTFARARAWFERHGDRRFFLFAHTYQVHEPYAPPPRYAGLFAGAGADALPHLRAMADYDREIRYVDDELRDLVSALERAGLAEDTVLVLTSDHGEEFLEHGLISHGGHLYEESVRVPLLLRGPGFPAGLRVATPVAQADLMPTLLALFGVAPPPGGQARSLLELARGGDAPDLAGRPLFSEGLVKFQAGPGGGRSFDPPTTAVRVGQRKLLRDRERGEQRLELYDLARDPGEHHNLLEAGEDAPDDLRALLDGYLGQREAEQRRLAEGADAAGAPPLDPERREKLRALGYLP